MYVTRNLYNDHFMMSESNLITLDRVLSLSRTFPKRKENVGDEGSFTLQFQLASVLDACCSIEL